ncbi:hypothetical protein ACFXG4_43740 [Nocardia sp. NPDC059246]|uniref:hypothetical protein n=1 Tax=unclassified Nocardia TaxID=2637762 RepID=UPI0036CD8772
MFDPIERADEVGTKRLIAGGRLDNEDGAGNWFALIRYPGDRALLFGWDRENHVWDKSYDPRAAAPEWVRALELKTHHPRVLTADAVSFVRWRENGRWHSTPTEHDDGLNMCLHNYAHAESLYGRVDTAYANAEYVAHDDDADEVLDHVSLDELTRLAEAAERYAVTEHDLNIHEPEVADAAIAISGRPASPPAPPQPVESLPATTQ